MAAGRRKRKRRVGQEGGPSEQPQPPLLTGQVLVEALAASPLREIEIERLTVTGPVRDVVLSDTDDADVKEPFP